jgi:protease-4
MTRLPTGSMATGPTAIGPDPRPADARPARDRIRGFVPWKARLFPGGRVAVVRLYGPISGGARSADWIELVRHLRESPRVPAVVLDIDSGGGSAAASDDLFIALERLASKKPLVAAIRGIGASGAYLAAMAAHRLVANPHAVVGSIGVLSVTPHVPRLLERAGVSVSVQKAGRHKDLHAPWRDETPEDEAIEQQLVDAYYDAFVDRVATGRGLPDERVRELATGQVWLGRQAVELGLVDETGDIERAIEIAAEMAGVPARGAPVRLRRPFVGRLIDRFTSRTAAAIVGEVEARLGDRVRM